MKLDDVRAEIDRIDTELKKLFMERMNMSAEVAKAKAKTGGTVYVPEREVEIIEKRLQDVEESRAKEYQMFLEQIINISRIYQYGMLTNMQKESIAELSEESGVAESEMKCSITASFACARTSNRLHLVLDMAEVCGVVLEDIRVEKTTNEMQFYTLKLKGDFTLPEKNVFSL
ncbi:MAG: chorismate mutase [Hespellia sp.]|nr:chorismate mutase [Hespellia sp.]